MGESFVKSKSYKVLDALINISFWVSIGISGVILIIMLMNIILPLNVSKLLISTAGLSFDGFVFINDASANEMGSKYIYLITYMIRLGAGILCILMLRNIVNSLRSGSPFTIQNVKRIRFLGWTLLIQTYISQLINYFYIKKLNSTYILEGIKPMAEARLTLIPEGVLLALGILVLAEIFRYGCNLQQEHDTTV